MSTKFIIIFVVAILLLAAGYWYWTSHRAPVAAPAVTPAQNALNNILQGTSNIASSASQGVLPSLGVPDANPTAKTNPFSGVKTNPFGQ